VIILLYEPKIEEKGHKWLKIWIEQILLHLDFALPWAKQSKITKTWLTFIEIIIVFSICNKPFKRFCYPSGRVRSHEGLLEIYPKIFELFLNLSKASRPMWRYVHTWLLTNIQTKHSIKRYLGYKMHHNSPFSPHTP